MAIEQPPATFLNDHLAYWAREKPEATAWIYGDKSWTWAQWFDRVQRAAGGLKAAGITSGDRVAFLDKNNPACVEISYATASLGAAHAVINWRFAGDELDYTINDSGAKLLFVGAELAEQIALIGERLTTVERVIIVGGENDEYESWLAGSEPTGQDPAVQPDDVCLVMYSSGTTGRPKGVMLTQKNMVLHTQRAAKGITYDEGDMPLVAMPLFHVGGTSYAMFGIAFGATSYMTREPDAASLSGGLMAGCTHAFLVPAVIGGILAAGDQAVALFGRLKFFSYGAAPMPLPMLRAALTAWPDTKFLQVYGMTEMAGVATSLSPEAHTDAEHPERLVSAGTPLDGVEVRVVDPATLRDVETGESGELWFRTEQATPGYLGNPDATAELLTDDGWLRSGDVGRLDDGGFMFVEDRVKDMIISGGENVYSPEIERVLAEHPAILELAVIGVPDDKWGESVKAVVAFHPGKSATPEELIAFAREKLAAYKCPTSIDIVEALPRNPTGKILKRDLRKHYWADRERQV